MKKTISTQLNDEKSNEDDEVLGNWPYRVTDYSGAGDNYAYSPRLNDDWFDVGLFILLSGLNILIGISLGLLIAHWFIYSG